MASAADAKNIAADAYLQTYPLLQTARELDRQMNTADAPDYVGKFNAFRHQDGLPSPKDASGPAQELRRAVLVGVARRPRRARRGAASGDSGRTLRRRPALRSLGTQPAARRREDERAKARQRARRRSGLERRAAQGYRPRRARRHLAVGVTGRTAAATPGDAASVAALQQQFRIVPLSRFAKTAAPKAAPPITFAAWDEAKADTGAFVGYVNALLPFVRLDAAEQVAFKRYAGIGMVAGKPWDPAKMDSAVVAAIDAGVNRRAQQAREGDGGRARRGRSGRHARGVRRRLDEARDQRGLRPASRREERDRRAADHRRRRRRPVSRRARSTDSSSRRGSCRPSTASGRSR